MQLHFHQVDAFSDRPFAGNPAMVYHLEQWLDEALMQQIAAEHNLAETAFVVSQRRVPWRASTSSIAVDPSRDAVVDVSRFADWPKYRCAAMPPWPALMCCSRSMASRRRGWTSRASRGH